MKLLHLRHDYHPLEDRICLHGTDAAGDGVRLWLTARLLHRAIRHLAGWLERNGMTGAAADAHTAVASARPLSRAASAAELRAGQPQPALQAANAPTAPATHLVEGLAVQSRGGRLRVVFRNDSGVDVAELWLTGDELRQWLRVLYRIFLQAEWPVANWPAWLVAPASTPAAVRTPGGMLLH